MNRKLGIRLVAGSVWLIVFFGCSDWERITPVTPDTTPPVTISDAALTFENSSKAVKLAWMSPRDPGSGGGATRYEIRYIYDQPFEWSSAIPVVDPPLPKPPGEDELYIFRHADPGRDLAVAILSVDAMGNASKPGNVATMVVPGLSVSGACTDAYTGDPVDGVGVEITGQTKYYALATDATGKFVQQDLSPQNIELAIGMKDTPPVHFAVVHDILLTEDFAGAFLMIPFEMSEVLPSTDLLTLFLTATGNAGGPGPNEIRKWSSRPVATYVPPFVNADGVDYAALGRAAVERWMDRTGLNLFEFVGTSPAQGIELSYRSASEMGINLALTSRTDGPDGLPLKDVIRIRNNLADSDLVYRILLHEFGHTIRLSHLPDRGFIMFHGQPLPGDISDDEVRIVQLLGALPNRTDMSVYRVPETK